MEKGEKMNFNEKRVNKIAIDIKKNNSYIFQVQSIIIRYCLYLKRWGITWITNNCYVIQSITYLL